MATYSLFLIPVPRIRLNAAFTVDSVNIFDQAQPFDLFGQSLILILNNLFS